MLGSVLLMGIETFLQRFSRVAETFLRLFLGLISPVSKMIDWEFFWGDK